MELATNPGSGSGRAEKIGEEIAAAFAWWREAGVDGDWLDAPHGWLAQPVAESAAQPLPRAEAGARPQAEPLAEARPVRLEIPEDRESFVTWWLSEPLLDNGQTAARIPPRGVSHAEVMVLVPEPEREDRDTLLSGPQGRLLAAMLAAMGIAPGSVYVASVLPRHTPHADWQAVRAAGLGEVLSRHVALAAPKRLIAFTGNILPLLGHDPANNPDSSQQFNHGAGSVPLLAARELAALLERSRWKAGFWQSWLDWTGREWTGGDSLAIGALETERS